ncbi:hypothetical protein GGI20_003214 [Coemansia sp. BCRC 34301]|nr:hypothetical protein GGI20_003214 [Coemansia sp. BCRC 34301]
MHLSAPNAPKTPVITLLVWFPKRNICEDCDDTEEITVCAFDNTVGQVKSIIATRFGIEEDEFVLYDPEDVVNSEAGMKEPFADSFLSSEAVSTLRAGELVKPVEVQLNVNPNCLLAVGNTTYVSLEAWNVRKHYEVQDTKCYTVDRVYSGNKNHVLISGYTAQFFANADCTGLVSINHQENP